MSELKINPNQFFGVQELRRRDLFLQGHGINRNFLLNSAQFGLFEDFELLETGQVLKEDCFNVSKAGTPYDVIVVNKGAAVDKFANIIFLKENLNLQVPADDNWYWVKIKHSFSTLEDGQVSIDALGNLTGTGTKFNSCLRGGANFPSKIKFYNSVSGNVYEYRVVKVQDDLNALLFGDFNAETSLKFSVVGTFTDGAVIPNDHKEIYKFDSSEITLVIEDAINEPPSFASGEEFYVARVKNNGTDVSIQDKRINWFKTNSKNLFEETNRVLSNPLIGVEAVKYDILYSTREKNIIELGFGFRFSSYTIDASAKKLSVLIGNGGKYKSTADFQNSDFDGWRLYYKNGSYSIITDSQKSGSQIVLTLDLLNPDDLGVSDKLFIAPPFESIEIKSIIPTLVDTEKTFEFPINTQIAKFPLNSIVGCTMYNLVYRFKNNFNFTDWKQFPDDPAGHYNETSFDVNGILNEEVEDRTLIPYVGSLVDGFIKVCEHPNSFYEFQTAISIGDLIGVNTTELLNSLPQLELYVGTSKQYQHFKNNITLSADIFIILKSVKQNGLPLREGNKFLLHFEQDIDLNGFKIRIVQNFIDPTDYELLTEIDANDCAYIKNNCVGLDDEIKKGMLVTCTFNSASKWIATYDTDLTPKGSIRFLDDVPSEYFDVSGNGIKAGFYGWRIFTELANKFVFGTTDADETGEVGGANSFALSVGNMPEHRHKLFTTEQVGYSPSADENKITENPDNFVPGRTSDGGDNDYSLTRSFVNPEPLAGNSGKSGLGIAFDNRPSFYKMLPIKKIV